MRAGHTRYAARSPWYAQIRDRDAQALAELLTGLAKLLIARRVTPAQLKALTDHAFIGAAADVSRLRNGRINQSRIAVLTGMRRSEIRRYLNSANSQFDHFSAPISDVISAWHTDQRFTLSSGQPRKLLITGGSRSFAHLIKRYVGDVPHRAVLVELLKLGAIRQTRNKVELIRNISAGQRRGTAGLTKLVPLMLDAISTFDRPANARRRGLIRRLTLEARTLTELALIRSRCLTGITSLMAALSGSMGPRNIRRGLKPARHRCSINVVFADHSSSD